MDNRLKFLYPVASECGDTAEKHAGKEKPVQALELHKRTKPCAFKRQRREASKHKVAKCWMSLSEKPLLCATGPYRKPTQVMGENPKAGGRSIAKELGKMSRNFGRRDAGVKTGAEDWPRQLFSKNTGLCETAR